MAPDVPWMVMTVGLAGRDAEAARASVTTCVPAAEPAANEAVIPVGRPLALNETCPENPPDPTMEMVLLALPPRARDNDAGNAASVNAGWMVMLRAI